MANLQTLKARLFKMHIHGWLTRWMCSLYDYDSYFKDPERSSHQAGAILSFVSNVDEGENWEDEHELFCGIAQDDKEKIAATDVAPSLMDVARCLAWLELSNKQSK